MRQLRTTWWLGVQLALVLTVALLGVVAAVTVQEPAPAGRDVLLLVRQAGQAAADAGSYRLELRFELDGPGPEVTVGGTSDVDAVSGDSTGRLELPGGDELEFLTVGGKGYFELPEASPARLAGKSWVSFPLAGGQQLTEDPLVFLRLLSGDNGVEDLGRDEVRGVRTSHFRSRLDRESLGELAAKQGQQTGTVLTPDALEALEGGTAELWLDDDGLPRRLRVELGAGGVDFDFSFELYEYGLDVQVTAPVAEEVVDVPTQAEAMQFLAGAA